jgi:hypothetical protein
MPVEKRPVCGCQTYHEWLRDVLGRGDIEELRRGRI